MGKMHYASAKQFAEFANTLSYSQSVSLRSTEWFTQSVNDWLGSTAIQSPIATAVQCKFNQSNSPAAPVSRNFSNLLISWSFFPFVSSPCFFSSSRSSVTLSFFGSISLMFPLNLDKKTSGMTPWIENKMAAIDPRHPIKSLLLYAAPIYSFFLSQWLNLSRHHLL